MKFILSIPNLPELELFEESKYINTTGRKHVALAGSCNLVDVILVKRDGKKSRFNPHSGRIFIDHFGKLMFFSKDQDHAYLVDSTSTENIWKISEWKELGQ